MPSSYQEPQDLTALLERVRTGDEASLLELLQRYEHRVRAAARVQVGDLLRPHLDSLDVVQSVYCALLPGLREGKYDLSSSDALMALAMGVLRRKIARHWRRVRREHPWPAGPELPPQAEACAQCSAAQHDPAELALANDQLRTIMAGSSDLDRTIIELRLRGYRTVEIAAKLNCGAAMLRARLSRLRERLRKSGYTEWL